MDIIAIALCLVIFLTVLSFCLTDEESLPYNVLILGLTAVVLIWNTTEVNKGTAENLKQNLRPVILHTFSLGGYYTVYDYWKRLENGSTTQMAFNIYYHIATNINGYVIINQKRIEFNLSTSNLADSSGNPDPLGGFICFKNKDTSSTNQVFWAHPDKKGLCANFNITSSTKTNKPNQICIQYEDIEGNKYYTKEDENLSPDLGMGTCDN